MHLEGGGYIFEQTFPIKSGYRFGGKCHNSIPKIGGIMNIYLGRNLENFDSNGKSVYFSDEILAYIYAIRNKIDINIESLEQMEPYDDVVIDNQQIVEIMNICEHILKNNVPMIGNCSKRRKSAWHRLLEFAKKRLRVIRI